MRLDPGAELGKRERQIMEIIYRRGHASASEVLRDLADPPSYSAVRGMLRYLESKGHLRHQVDGRKYVYLPVSSPTQVRRSALSHVIGTFFGGSISSAVATLIEDEGLSASEHERLTRLLAELGEGEQE